MRSIDLDLEFARQVFLAESLEIGEGRDGLRRLPGDVQAQLPLLRLLDWFRRLPFDPWL